MLVLTVALAMVLVGVLKQFHSKIPPLDHKEMERHRMLSDRACREWLYPFE